MSNIGDHYARLQAIQAALRPLESQVNALRREAEQLALDLLRAGEPPSVVADLCPFTATHLRNLARKAGIPPAPKGGGPKGPSTPPTSPDQGRSRTTSPDGED